MAGPSRRGVPQRDRPQTRAGTAGRAKRSRSSSPKGLPGLEAVLLGQGGLQTALSANSAQGALVLDTTDVAKAKSFLEGQAHSAGAHTTSYRGVTYQVSPDGVAEGIVHKFAVIGSEAGVKSVIETAAGGSSLAQASAYSKLASTAEHGALANAYLSPEELAHALAGAVAAVVGAPAARNRSCRCWKACSATPVRCTCR